MWPEIIAWVMEGRKQVVRKVSGGVGFLFILAAELG